MTHPVSPAAPAFELTTSEWREIERLLPPPNTRGRPFADRRRVMNGVIWQYLTACPWRAVPRQYAPWQTCYHYRRELDRLGLWPDIVRELRPVPQSPLTDDAPEPAPPGTPDIHQNGI